SRRQVDRLAEIIEPSVQRHRKAWSDMSTNFQRYQFLACTIIEVPDLREHVQRGMNSAQRLVKGRHQSWSALSTLAAILSGTPQCSAMWMARSTRFSGAMRPRNAKYEGLIGRGPNSSAGRP